MSELVIRPAEFEDLQGLAGFMRSHGTDHASAEYLAHWYFDNPSGSASVIVGWLDGRIVGMATINDHYFHRKGSEVALVGMPQKVLTDERVRGKGIFGKLYHASQAACLERGVDYFLTVTNAASTPIFLSKFGHVRVPSPGLVALSARPGNAVVRSMEGAFATTPSASTRAWSMRKDDVHFAWRYKDYPGSVHRVLEVGPKGASDGLIMVRRVRKMGLPFLLLMDALPATPERGAALLHGARITAWRERAAGVLVLKQEQMMPWMDGQFVKIERSSGFNLLVKGRDGEHTRRLLSDGFELAFGDLDFF